MSSWRKFLTGSQESRLNSLPPLSSLLPPPTCSSPPLHSFSHTFLRSCCPVENQHVAPGHKSGSVKLTCTCPVFTSSSFPLGVTQHFLLIYSPPSSPDQLAHFSPSSSKHSGFTKILSLCPESVTRLQVGKLMLADPQKKVQLLLLNLLLSLFL